MYIYTGRFSWLKYAQDEMLIFILPEGPVRVGDTIYFFTQWGLGEKKDNWFNKQTVETVTKNDYGQDVFTLAHKYYSYNIVVGNDYQSLSIAMSNPHGAKSDLTVSRVYQPESKTSIESGRIWTGKLNWGEKAKDEAILVAVPEGFGEGNPAFVFWQWTMGKDLSSLVLRQMRAKEEENGVDLQFSDSHYCFNGKWHKDTEKLDLSLATEDGSSVKINSLDLSVLIAAHSHDVEPPNPAIETRELEVRLPQAEPSLARIQTLMPFPATLMETLTQTASFLDQSGYLARNVLERYQALDSSYDDARREVDSCKAQITELTSKVRELTDQGEVEKQKSADLEKRLAEARDSAAKKEAELTKQIQTLQQTISSDKDHDAADHKALDEAHQTIQKEQAEKNALQKLLDESKTALAAAEARILQLTAQVSDLKADLAHVTSQLEVEREHNEELEKTQKDLKQKLSKAEADLTSAQKSLARTKEDLAQSQSDCDDKDKIIEGLENGLVAVKKDRDAKKRAFDQLKKSTDEIIQELEAKLAASSGSSSWQPPNNGLFPFGQDIPTPLQQSINKHSGKASWARLSPWVGEMSNRGNFFNSLDDINENSRLDGIEIHANNDWISGFVLKWTDGTSKQYGRLQNQAQYFIEQTKDLPIVAAHVLTDDCRGPYQPVSHLTAFAFDKTAGYKQVGQYISGHHTNNWNKPTGQSSFAPALDGSWSLRGLYGYYDGSLDALGFVWGREE